MDIKHLRNASVLGLIMRFVLFFVPFIHLNNYGRYWLRESDSREIDKMREYFGVRCIGTVSACAHTWYANRRGRFLKLCGSESKKVMPMTEIIHRQNNDGSKRYTLAIIERSDNLTIATTYLEPKQATRGHSHAKPEDYYFHSDCILKLDGVETYIKAPNHVHIEPNVHHQVINLSETLTIFTCTYETGSK